MNNNRTWAILITILALFLRVYLAVNGPFEPDETVYFDAAVKYSQAMRSGDWDQILNSSFNSEHPQLNKLIYGAALLPFNPLKNVAFLEGGHALKEIPYWLRLVGLRLISVFFGTATVFVVSLINPLAGLFLAVDTFEIKYTSVIYLEALPQLLSLLSLLSALKAMEIYQGDAGRKSRAWLKWSLFSALSMGMALASKYLYGVMMVVIAAAVLWRGRKSRGRLLLGLAGWGLLCAAFFGLFDPVLWNGPLERLWSSFQYSFEYSNSIHASRAGYPFWQPLLWLMVSIPQYSGNTRPFFMNQADYFVLADSIIFLLALVGLPRLYQKDKPVFLWLLIGCVFLLFWRTKWPQYVMLVIPAICLSAARGFEWLRLRNQ